MNNLGFSIAQAIMITGTVSLMITAIVTNVDQSQKTIKNLEIKLEQVNFANDFRQELSTESACVSAFSDVTLTPITLQPNATISLPSNQIRFKGQLLSNQNFEWFSSATIEFKVSSIPGAGSAIGTMNIDLTPKPEFSKYLKPKMISEPFSIQFNPLGKITKCPSLVPTAPKFVSSQCYIIDNYVPEGTTITKSCNAGDTFMFASGIPGGRKDGVGSYNLSVTTDTIRVRAVRESWRILAKCCKQNYN